MSVYENGNGMKLNIEIGLRNSLLLGGKKSVEIPGRRKTRRDLNQVSVHLKIKVDVWIFFPPFHVRLLGTVYFSYNCGFSALLKEQGCIKELKLF